MLEEIENEAEFFPHPQPIAGSPDLTFFLKKLEGLEPYSNFIHNRTKQFI
jgi:hypothetical protein